MASHGLKTLLYIFKDFIKVPFTHFWEHHFQLPIFFALLRTPLPTAKKGSFCAFHAIASSSETQGQLVGSIKCSWWKFSVRWDEPLGTYSYRTSSRSVWIACLWLARKTFFWPISEEKLPGDSRVFLHDVVYLIYRHSCVARSTGKVSEQNVNNPQNCNL